jgi:hypothetical protein
VVDEESQTAARLVTLHIECSSCHPKAPALQRCQMYRRLFRWTCRVRGRPMPWEACSSLRHGLLELRSVISRLETWPGYSEISAVIMRGCSKEDDLPGRHPFKKTLFQHRSPRNEAPTSCLAVTRVARRGLEDKSTTNRSGLWSRWVFVILTGAFVVLNWAQRTVLSYVFLSLVRLDRSLYLAAC